MPVTIQSTSFRYKNSNGTFESAACIKGEGVPTGGTIGQVLRKVSDDNYDTEWSDMEVATLEETAEIINNYGMGDDDSMLVETEFQISDGSGFIDADQPYYETIMNASDIAAAYKAGKSVIFKIPASDEEYGIYDDIYMQLVGFEEGDGFDTTFEDIDNAHEGDDENPVIPKLPRFTFKLDRIQNKEEASAINNIVNCICVNNKVYFGIAYTPISDGPVV